MAATSAARKPVKPANKRAPSKSLTQGGATRYPKGKSGNPKGRPLGSKNKTTRIQLEAAKEAFAPMAKRALEIGAKHLEDCEINGCAACQWWAHEAFQYHYGKPIARIEVDQAALRTEMEAIAAATGKTVEEIEQEAHDAGIRIMARYQ